MTDRTSITSRTLRSVTGTLIAPLRGTSVRSPSASRRRNASRTGVRL
ncbi:MAG: hypothetical protein QOF29_4093, partial [bacterium]